MKRRTRQTTKKILMIALSALTIVNVFCIGFSSFLYKGPSIAIGGNINVSSGGSIQPTIDAKTPVTSSIVTPHGFKDTETFSNDGFIKLHLNIKFNINSKAKASISFSISQVDNPNEPGYFDFDLTRYINDISISTTTNGIKMPEKEYPALNNEKAKCKYASFSTKDPCFAQGFQNFEALTIVTFKIHYTGTDFAEDIYGPLQIGKPTFDMEVKGIE